MRRYWLALALFLPLAHVSAGLDVPIDMQVAVLKKVLKFDQSLPATGKTTVLVVHEDDQKMATALVGAFKGAGFDSRVSQAGSLPGDLGEAKVVYFCAGSEGAAAKVPAGVLTLCGNSQPAEQNKVAIGLGLVDGKPKLMVSLTAYNACGHTIDSQVLGLAKIFR